MMNMYTRAGNSNKSVEMKSELERATVEGVELLEVGHSVLAGFRIQRIFPVIELLTFLVVCQYLFVGEIAD